MSLNQEITLKECILLVRNTTSLFGTRLKEYCDLLEISQEDLSIQSILTHAEMVKTGEISPDTNVGSLLQPTISKIINHRQAPNYYQVAIWFRIFSKILKNILNTDYALIDELESEFFHLATFITPRELEEELRASMDIFASMPQISLIEHKELRWQPGYQKKE